MGAKLARFCLGRGQKWFHPAGGAMSTMVCAGFRRTGVRDQLPELTQPEGDQPATLFVDSDPNLQLCSFDLEESGGFPKQLRGF